MNQKEINRWIESDQQALRMTLDQQDHPKVQDRIEAFETLQNEFQKELIRLQMEKRHDQ